MTRHTIPALVGVPIIMRRAIEADTDGLRTALLTLIRANTPTPGTVIAVSPTPAGAWQPPKRPNGARLMWVTRPGVAEPTTSDGYDPATDFIVTST